MSLAARIMPALPSPSEVPRPPLRALSPILSAPFS